MKKRLLLIMMLLLILPLLATACDGDEEEDGDDDATDRPAATTVATEEAAPVETEEAAPAPTEEAAPVETEEAAAVPTEEPAPVETEAAAAPTEEAVAAAPTEEVQELAAAPTEEVAAVPTEEAAAAPTEEVAAAATEEAAPTDSTRVDVWIAFNDYRLDWANERAAEFNAMFPQYEVVITGGYSYEDVFAQVAVAAEQDELPAVVQFFEAGTQDARDSGLFKPVEDALNDRTEIDGLEVNLDDFVGPVRAYYTLDGRFTSMPWNASSAIMFSNKNILDAAGVEALPTTWAEMEAACEKVMALDDAPEFCFTFPNHGWFFEQWLAQQDALFVNNDNGRAERATEVAFNSEAGVAVLAWLDDMAEKGYLYYSGAQGGDSWATVDQAYQTQQVAMAIYSSSDTTYYTNMGKDNGFETVASFLPYNQEAGWTGNLIGGATLWLVDGLEPEVENGALAFLLYLTNTENAADWHKTTGYVAIRESANELLTSEGWFEENPNHTVAADQLSQSTVTPATSGALVGGFPAIRNLVTGAIDRVLLTDDDPADVLNDAAAEANIIIEEYNLLNAPE